MVTLLKQRDIRERFFRSGMETLGSTPEEFAAFIQADMQRINNVISATGVER